MKMVNLFRDSGLVLIALFLISFETKAVDNLHGGVDKSIEIYVSITPKDRQTGSKPHYVRLKRQELESLANGQTLLCQFNFDKGSRVAYCRHCSSNIKFTCANFSAILYKKYF